ncbi:MAG: LpxI family protein, partial [Kiloniellaceae bacterium]
MAAKLGVIAGGGELPARLVETCRATGRDVFVLAFEGQTDPATVDGVDHAWTRLGRPGAAGQTLREAG